MEFGRSNYIDHTERPLHESLAYVPLNSELCKALVSTDPEDHKDLRPINFKKTRWDFASSAWVIEYEEVTDPEVDPLEEVLKIKQDLINKANLKLAMPDISDKYKTTLENFVAEIVAIEVTKDNILEIAPLFQVSIP